MSELAPSRPPARDELAETLQQWLGEQTPPLCAIARNLLGDGCRIDLVAVDPSGGVVLVMIADEREDQALLTRGLAQRAWVTARIPDWSQLAPEIHLRAEAPTRLLLVCPRFDGQTLAAARALGPETVQLAEVRGVRNGSYTGTLVEIVEPRHRAPEHDHWAADPVHSATAPKAPSEFEQVPSTDAVARPSRSLHPSEPSQSVPPFRSGLTEADLDLSAEEISDFE